MNEILLSDKKFVSQIIKNARKAIGFTQAEVANRIGMSEKNYVNIENGKQLPQLDSFFKIVEVLEISLDEFGVRYKISDKNKQELLKLVLSSTVKDCERYLKFINCFKDAELIISCK